MDRLQRTHLPTADSVLERVSIALRDVQRGKQNGNLDVSAARTQIASLLTNLQRLENDHTVPEDLLKSTIQSVVLVRDSLPDLTQHAQHSSHSVDRYVPAKLTGPQDMTGKKIGGPYRNQTNVTDDDSLPVSFPASCNESIVGEIRHYLTPLVESHFLLALIYCILVVAALCVGSIGNIIILAVSTTTRAMNRVGRDFVINLALADLCVALISDPMCILGELTFILSLSVSLPAGVLKGERWFQSRWLLCEVVASMCLTACFCAFFSLTLLTLNRYVFVCKNVWYDTIFKRPVCILMCACAWVLAFLFEFPNFVGWGDHYFDQKSQQCIWDRTASFSYTLVVAAGLIGSPLLLMGVCFVLIFYKIYQSKMDVYSLNVDDPLRYKMERSVLVIV
ncbi:melatonin receptor type 1B-A-like [Dreissena polymorpha]|uniref:melatonin receptor type 1B-A-like n=1 Tax=Dreissena polymorpha TaxID=45954 RepID=UPI0022641947|nr:melatonin receptor type 1B-A-like [Dreissena polymorpha]